MLLLLLHASDLHPVQVLPWLYRGIPAFGASGSAFRERLLAAACFGNDVFSTSESNHGIMLFIISIKWHFDG